MTGPVAEAMRQRRSHSSVTDAAPTRRELLPLIEAAASVADHASLKPWRLIALRGDARLRFGEAIAQAEGDSKPSTKPLRSSLIIAVVFSPKHSSKVPSWEQEAVASGIAHALSLLLDEDGWGVFWRTGHYTRSKPVARMHKLKSDEQLMGWLYVGGKPERKKSGHRRPINPKKFLTTL